jgi:thiaminase (transcriptional activator TenA)
MTLSARLWAANSDLAQLALTHPFVTGIADGSLPPQRFAAFIAQDVFFLDAFARAYALALVRAPDTATLLTLADLIGGVRAELGVHNSSIGIGAVDAMTVEPTPATLAYTDFLVAVAATRGDGLIYAAMTPCMRLYAFLGSNLNPGPADRYADWITTHAHPEFQALTARLEWLLDSSVPDAVAASTLYRRAMTLELDFFDAV